MSAPLFSGATREEFAEVGRGITLCFERIGDPGATPLVLVAGLGQQLHAWPTAFCELLAELGFTVYRFDNRDVGRSTHVDTPSPGLWQILTGRFDPRQYTVADLARDTVGLIEALGLESAHLAGMSMGGMISQTAAAHFPTRVRSLASIFSNTGAKRLGRPAWSTWPLLMGAPPADRAAAADAAVKTYRHIASHGFPFDERWVRADAEAAWDRDPGGGAGVGRQLAGIFASGDRTAELADIRVPTVVVHGDRDRMVASSGGLATARAIPNARLVSIAGMGHDLPFAAWPRLTKLIKENADAAAAARPGATTADVSKKSTDESSSANRSNGGRAAGRRNADAEKTA